MWSFHFPQNVCISTGLLPVLIAELKYLAQMYVIIPGHLNFGIRKKWLQLLWTSKLNKVVINKYLNTYQGV